MGRPLPWRPIWLQVRVRTAAAHGSYAYRLRCGSRVPGARLLAPISGLARLGVGKRLAIVSRLGAVPAAYGCGRG